MDRGIFLVGLEDGKYWCSNKTPFHNPTYHNYAFEYRESLRCAYNEATLLMMKHPIKNDMSQAKIVSNPQVAWGMPYLDAPKYIDYNETRKTPTQVWVIEAPTRYQAVKIAKQDYNNKLLMLDSK